MGVTLVTGRGIGAVLDEVQHRLDLLKGKVVESYQLWEPARGSDTYGAISGHSPAVVLTVQA